MARVWAKALLGLLQGRGRDLAAGAADLPVFDLDHEHGCNPRELTQLLGGKGAGLAEMRRVLALPVPPGFVLGTPLCHRFLEQGWPAELDRLIGARLAQVEQMTGQVFGDGRRPLFLSVRSGAPISMPGMMDTILNLGANAETIAALAALSGDERFACDTWAKFCRMYATTVLELPADELGPALPRDASLDQLRADVARVQQLCRARGLAIPDEPGRQLRSAIEAVFRSWRSRRAGIYREREGIAENLGTAVVVQAMVFGNRGKTSGTGVAFSRDPSTGANQPCGDFLLDAQGEDVVAGTHRTDGLAAMAQHVPGAHAALLAALQRLERHHRDLCDIEFTVQDGSLYLLQTRAGKRSAIAAARMAVEMVADPAIRLSREEALRRVSGEQLRRLQSFARVKAEALPAASGVAASPGVAAGIVCTDPDRVEDLAQAGASVILVRPTTSPEDVHGMVAAAGIVTATGGMLSHAALVARSWGIPAVCGADLVVSEGDVITIDGDRGLIYRGDQQEPGHGEPPELRVLRGWAAELGIEFDAAPAGEAKSLAGGHDVDPFDLLRALQLRGFASVEQLAASLLASADAVRTMLAGLETGLVDSTPRGLHPTAKGRAWLAAALAEERARLDPHELATLYDAFMQHDARFKKAVTAWQVKLVDGLPVTNDHADADYDGAVLAALAALHDQALPLLARATAALPRLERYAARLDQAAAKIAAGDVTLIASPLKDSYHTVWFELHEELISLSGRDRAAEEQKRA